MMLPTYRMDHMPYGGVKDSGFGREGVRYAMEEMTEMKLLLRYLRRRGSNSLFPAVCAFMPPDLRHDLILVRCSVSVHTRG